MKGDAAENLADLFKAYDVRGRTDTCELTPEIMLGIGAAFATTFEQESVMVGRDCRLTSKDLSEAFIAGARRQGKNVWDLGLTTTDALYYSTTRHEAAGAMITASHNPANYNGVKLCKAGAVPMSSEELEACRDRVPRLGRPEVPEGKLGHIDIMPAYLEHLLSLIGDVERMGGLRVAVDGSNGMAGLAIGRVFESLPAELLGLHLELDGNFPNHPADPSYGENLTDLIDLVRRESPDLGVIFDGDADRAVFVDDRGEPLSGSTTVALLSHWYLTRKQPSATIVHDSICSRMVPRTIERYGGRAVRSRVGTPFIRQTMMKAGADFAAETSGHCYFKENSMIDSGLLTMLCMMRIRAEAGEPLSVLRKKFEHRNAYGKTTFKVVDRDVVLRRVANAFAGRGQLDFFDGLIAEWPDRWFSLRPSNTEPIVRLHAEAGNSTDLEQMMQEVAELIKRISASA